MAAETLAELGHPEDGADKDEQRSGAEGCVCDAQSVTGTRARGRHRLDLHNKKALNKVDCRREA